MSAAPQATAVQPMTADELIKLPTGMGQRYELVAGEVRTMSPAGFEHGTIVGALHERISTHVRQARLGRVAGAETGFRLSTDPDTVRAPDISFVSGDRLQALRQPIRGFFPGAPDLAVEVVSPDDSASEVQTKVNDYFAAGARQMWVVYPASRQVAVFRSARESLVLGAGEALEGGDLLPGFTCPVAELFE